MTARRIAAAAGLALGGFALVALIMFGPHALHPKLSANTASVELSDVNGLVHDSDIKVDGIVVGSVQRLRVTPRDTVVVEMHLDSPVRLGRGATATLRSANLLGERYIHVRTGNLRRPLPDGARLRAGTTPVELDEVLNMLDEPTRVRLRVLLHEAGLALLGRGSDLNTLLGELPGSLEATTRVIDQVASENRRLGALLEHADRFAVTAARQRAELQDLVVGAQRALAVTARKRRELNRTLGAAPAALEQLRGSVTRVIALARPLKPAARALSAAAPALTSTLRALPAFETAAGPALRAAAAAAPPLQRLGRAGAGPVRRLRPALADVARLAAALKPVSRTLDHSGGMKSALDYISGFAGAMSHADGLGHYMRIHLAIDKTLVTGLVDELVALGTDKRATRRSPAPSRDVAPAVPKPRPGTRPAKPAVNVPRVELPRVELPRVLDDTVKPTTQRLQKLLDHLLGP